MTTATIEHTGRRIDIGGIARQFAPGSTSFDPFGLVSGYKAYLIYTALAAKSNAELAAMGLDRTALPAVAMRAATEARRG